MILLLIVLSIIAIIIYKSVKGLVDIGKSPKNCFIQLSSITDEKEMGLKEEENLESTPLQVEIKDSNINASRIIEYKGENVKSFSWYPKNFNQFIGQTEAKEQAKTIMAKVKKGIKCHTILSAIQGHGKSTFVRLLAKSLNARLIERVGKQIDFDTLVDIINEINTCPEKNVIFFLDEIDTADWKVLKLLNPVLQDFLISGKKIKPFLFCCATINKDLLIKQTPDLLDRIPHAIQFKRYNSKEISAILKQYKNQLYYKENVSDKIIDIIGDSCKFNPRLSLGLLEDFIVTQDIVKTLRDRRIVKTGLTQVDIKILKVLNQAVRPMGCNALSQKIGLSQNQYTREYEPYLCEFNFIERVPSRKITEKGKTFLKELQYE